MSFIFYEGDENKWRGKSKSVPKAGLANSRGSG